MSLIKKTHMKLKLTLLVMLFLGMGFIANAQKSAADTDAETNAIITLLGIQKKEAVAQLVHLEKKDSAAFWKLYSEYQIANNKNAKTRMQLYEKTAEAYNSMSVKTADSLATQFFKQRAEQEKSIEEYYTKIKTATNTVVAFQFYQTEVYLLTQIRAQIMQQIPTYGQLLNAAKH
jgi:hypothetical protein